MGTKICFLCVGIWCITVIEKLMMKSTLKADVLKCCCARIALYCQGFGNPVDVKCVCKAFHTCDRCDSFNRCFRDRFMLGGMTLNV